MREIDINRIREMVHNEMLGYTKDEKEKIIDGIRFLMEDIDLFEWESIYDFRKGSPERMVLTGIQDYLKTHTVEQFLKEQEDVLLLDYIHDSKVAMGMFMQLENEQEAL